MPTNLSPSLSESGQMYLVNILRLREGTKPVPLSRLAEELGVSPVSVNEMCRKLQDQGLVNYQPYRGAALTAEGERRAAHVLRRHRLWEVFLVEKLGLEFDAAHEAACRLEHSTPELVADLLDRFLGYPRSNPRGEAIPRQGKPKETPPIPLVEATIGDRGRIVRLRTTGAASAFLRAQRLVPGTAFEVLGKGEAGLLLRVGHDQVVLASDVASKIDVHLS